VEIRAWLENPSADAPCSQVCLTPCDKIPLTLCAKTKLTPDAEVPQWIFFDIFGFRFGRWDLIQGNMNTKLKNILLCYASGMGIKNISSAFGISSNTVRRYVRMYQDSGISAEKLPSLSDARLQ